MDARSPQRTEIGTRSERMRSNFLFAAKWRDTPEPNQPGAVYTAMLRIRPCQNASQAKSYYATADYYLEGEQELPGTWHGKGAARLGLAGTVAHEQWEALCDNLHPETGKRLTQATRSNRRIGYDFTFDVPKSVSLLYAFTKDQRIVDAFSRSVDETMADIEAEMKTRVRKSGADSDRVTGEAVWGKFIHFTTRPEDGVPDPHLHAHCFGFNATFDPTEKRWKAGQFGDVKADGPYFEGLFTARLAERLERLGLPTDRTKHGFELAGFDRSLVRRFSRRTARIEKMAAELGITDPKEKGELGAKTRNRKAKHLRFDELAALWKSWLREDESRMLLEHGYRLETGLNEFRDSHDAAKHAIEAAITHQFERASVVPERKLLGQALKRGAGRASVATIKDAFGRAELIAGELRGERVVTTRAVLEEERQYLAFAREGRGTCEPLGKAGRTVIDKELSGSQRKAVEHILRSGDRVILLRGAAGTGKTRSIRETVAGIEEGDRKVFAFAPSAAAGRGVLREEVSEQSNTVAHLLANAKLHEQIRGNVIWIDEAGLASVAQLRDVFDLAGRLDARVVISGDKRQHTSVARGEALRLLESEAGLVPAELREIQRQKGRYMEVVQALADGETEAGFMQLDEMGWIHELPEEERYAKLASDYSAARAVLDPKKKLLVVAPTHREAEKVTAALRDTLRQSGQLGRHERWFDTLHRVDMTAAERADPLSYQPGDVVVMQRNAPGLRKGERIVVSGKAANVPLHLAERFQVYQRRTLPVAAGDDIRITAGGKSADGNRLENGAIYRVSGITKRGDIKLANGWVIDRMYGHFTHGFVTTSHAAQGRSPERVFVAMGADSYPASSASQFYVSVSRGKHRADIYTDDAKAILEAVKRSEQSLSATELARQRIRGEHRAAAQPKPPERETRKRREREMDEVLP